jgi:A/G-specific adenine glycosylase
VKSFPKLNPGERGRFRRKLLHWFRIYKRDLPWRGTHDPYAVWVSEIMLQQTRVATVEERYVEIMRRFPNVQSLAAAALDEVLALWSGLGYYRRARMMHEAARVIVDERMGALPTSAEQWRTLPGIGRYTAAAIASIACGEPVCVVDGNVERVLTRIHGSALCGEQVPGKRMSGKQVSAEEVWAAADELLSRKHPGDFNQAMMELGATVCTPKSPGCLTCPVREFCATRGEHATVAPATRRKRDVAYALARRGEKIGLVRRGAGESLMAGMWELPAGVANGRSAMMTVKHAITTTDYTVRVFECRREDGREDATCDDSKVRWFRTGELAQLPLTGLARKVLKRAGIIE